MYQEEELTGATTSVEGTNQGHSPGSREVFRTTSAKGKWSALELPVVPFAEIKKLLSDLAKVERELGALFSVKSHVLSELKEKLTGKEVAYTLNELESLLRDDNAFELLTEDASAYQLLKETPFRAFLKEPVHSSTLRNYARIVGKLLEGEVEQAQYRGNFAKEDLESLKEDLNDLRVKLTAFEDVLYEFRERLYGLAGGEEAEGEKTSVERGFLDQEVLYRLEALEQRLEALEQRFEEARSYSPEEGQEDFRGSFGTDLDEIQEILSQVQYRLSDIERRPVGVDVDEFLALRDTVKSLAEEVRELKSSKTAFTSVKAEEKPAEEEESLGSTLEESDERPQPVQGKKLPFDLKGNAVYVAIAGLAGLIFLIAILIK